VHGSAELPPTGGDGSNPANAGGPAVERRRGPDRRRDGRVRIAAVGDFHCGAEDAGAYRDLFAEVNGQADVLLLTGDLTRRGEAAEFKIVVSELADVKIPIVAVLGNHDYEANEVAQGSKLLRARGIHLLDGDHFQLDEQVGFAGVKGFMGGFGRGTLTAFGEPETKAFVQAGLAQVQALELALRRLATPIRIAVLHYSPILATVVGEPEFIYPFLGTDRLADALDRHGATVVFHGHVHSGTFSGRTPAGVPVYNVSLPLLRRAGIGRMFFIHEIATTAPQMAPASSPASVP
jgi:Icc-related predicted phosphoesterase